MRLKTLLPALLGALLLLAAPPARATDEIQVYTGEVAAPGEWSLLQHLNYGFTRRKGTDRSMINAFRTVNGTPELAYGVTDWYETGLYLPFAARDDRFFPGGAKFRNLFVSPDAPNRTFFYGINTELSWAPQRFSRSRWNVEFRPILGLNLGRWQIVSNPIVGIGLGGKQPDAFLPANRIFYTVQEDLAVGVETYSDLGSFGHFGKFNQQAHQVFAAADFRLFGMDVNFGVGRGLTPASDRWMVKTIFGFSF